MYREFFKNKFLMNYYISNLAPIEPVSFERNEQRYRRKRDWSSLKLDISASKKTNPTSFSKQVGFLY